MKPDEYQKLADRTVCNQKVARDRVSTQIMKLHHSVIGLTGEVGELACAVEKHVWYGQELDVTNVKEELGDCVWYIAEACNALGLSLAETMEGNINKLKARFPDKFTEHDAAEENRDRDAERKILERATDDGVDYTDEEDPCGPDGDGLTLGDAHVTHTPLSLGGTTTGKIASDRHNFVDKFCPHCKNPVSDEYIRRVYASGNDPHGQCIACRLHFTINLQTLELVRED